MVFSKMSGQQLWHNILLVCSIVFFIYPSESTAQFTFSNSLKGAKPSEIILGGGNPGQSAVFTSGTVDPQGAGWLRLNDGTGSQRGFAYLDKSFPSNLGVLIEFEYTAWRTIDGHGGGDGFVVFLFDAAVPEFRLGGWGGSLGYAPNKATTPPVPQGLAGGYIGLGFDSYGNYGVNVEGKIGGIERDPSNAVSIPNTVILRGPTTADPSTTNRYLAGVKLGDRSGSPGDIRKRGEVDYDPHVSSRPTDEQFYRRVQIEIQPTAGGAYKINVRWKRSRAAGPFTDLISYTMTDIPPSFLKIGFAGSTGSAVNYHEIRNLFITTPGNLRVNKSADRDIMRTIPAGSNANTISYTIEVHNDTPTALANVLFKDSITDGIGNLLSGGVGGDFRVTNITHTGFNEGTELPTPTASSPLLSNIIAGSLNMAAESVGYITVTGTLHVVPSQNILKNTVNVMPTDISDFDLENNTASVSTVVIAEKVDLVVSHKANQDCIAGSSANIFTGTISNLGSLDAAYGGVTITGTGSSEREYSRNRLELAHITPPGVTFSPSTIPTGWTLVETASDSPSAGYTTRIYRTTFKEPTKTADNITSIPDDKSLRSGFSMPDFQFVLTSASAYDSEVRVRFVQEKGTVRRVNNSWVFDPPTSVENIEPAENRMNNSATVSVYPVPTAVPVVSSPIYYCLGDQASPLSATVTDPMYSLRWYSSESGVALNNIPVPRTNTAGTTQYFVRQVNGVCEGPAATVDVIVLAAPTPGSISGDQTICSDNSLASIISTAAGTAPAWPAGTALSYLWEVSDNGIDGWSAIDGATAAEYVPSTSASTRYYRRRTRASVGGKTCVSAPTNVVVKEVLQVSSGAISGDQTVCNINEIATLTSTSSGSTIAGATVSYRWEESSSLDNAGWVVIEGATGEAYTPPSKAHAGEYKYRRVTIATKDSLSCEVSTPEVTVIVTTCPAVTNPTLRSRGVRSQ